MDKKQLDDVIGRAWESFKQVALQAESEEQLFGSATGETKGAIDRLNHRLDEIEQQYARMQHPGALYAPHTYTKALTLNGERFAYDTHTLSHKRFVDALRYGPSEHTLERLPIADIARLDEINQDIEATKTMTQANDVSGGYLVSPEFANEVLRLSLDMSPVLRIARVVLSASPQKVIPVRGTVQSARRVGEIETRTNTTPDQAFRVQQVPTHELVAGPTDVSRALLADSQYDLALELADGTATEFALTIGTEFVSGDGNGKFRGLNSYTLPTAQVLTAADSTNHTVTADELAQVVFEKLKPQYQPNATLLMNGVSLSKLRQLKATSGNTFLFANDAPGTFFGVPYVLCPDLDAIGSAAGKSVLYVGDFRQAYAVVIRQDAVVQRLDEVAAEQGLVRFVIFERNGGQLVNMDAIAKIVTA